MAADDSRADFADGLQLNRLHPPAIISFMQGLGRRVADAVLPAEVDDGQDVPDDESAENVAEDAGPVVASEALDPLLDTLADTIQRLQEAGFAPDRDVRDHAPARVREDTDLARVNAAALQVARLVAGVPDRAWSEQPDLLDDVRSRCAQASQRLASLESTASDRTG